MTVEVCNCKRCGHQWAMRLKHKKPKNCPNCKSYLWDKEYSKKKRKEAAMA